MEATVAKKKLVFLQGLPCSGKKSIAEKLCKKRHYGVVDFASLNLNGTAEEAVCGLIKEIANQPQQVSH